MSPERRHSPSGFGYNDHADRGAEGRRRNHMRQVMTCSMPDDDIGKMDGWAQTHRARNGPAMRLKCQPHVLSAGLGAG